MAKTRQRRKDSRTLLGMLSALLLGILLLPFRCIWLFFGWLGRAGERAKRRNRHRMLRARARSFEKFDDMTGAEFEDYVAFLLEENGFERVALTPASGDYGADVLAERDGVRYAFQCKLYGSPVGNKAVQEIHAGREFYGCNLGVVVTNQHFTPAARAQAEAVGVWLWDAAALFALERGELEEVVEYA